MFAARWIALLKIGSLIERTYKGKTSKLQRAPKLFMLESAGHAGDFGGAGTHCPGHVAPGGRHLGDLPDDGAGLWQVEAKQGRCGLEQVKRTGAVVEVDAGGQHAGLEIGGDRVEVIGG